MSLELRKIVPAFWDHQNYRSSRPYCGIQTLHCLDEKKQWGGRLPLSKNMSRKPKWDFFKLVFSDCSWGEAIDLCSNVFLIHVFVSPMRRRHPINERKQSVNEKDVKKKEKDVKRGKEREKGGKDDSGNIRYT